MAVTVEKYDQLGDLIATGAFAGNTIKAMLVDSSYTFDPTHTLLSSVFLAEISGTGYTAGGEPLVNLTVTGDDTGFKIDADDVLWQALTATFRRAIFYISGTFNGQENPLLVSYLLDSTPADVSIGGINYQIIFNADGLISANWV